MSYRMVIELGRTMHAGGHHIILGCSSCNWKAVISGKPFTHPAYAEEMVRLVALEHDCWGADELEQGTT